MDESRINFNESEQRWYLDGKPCPKIGDKIWVGPTDEYNGGSGKVKLVKPQTSGGQKVIFVTVDTQPSVSYNWEHLEEEQKELKQDYPGKASVDWEYIHYRYPISHNWKQCPVCHEAKGVL